jgi:hypothetical protein
MNPNDDREEPVRLEPTESNGAETKQARNTSSRTGTFPDYLKALHGDFKTFREDLSSTLGSVIDKDAMSQVMLSVEKLEDKLTVRAKKLKSTCIASITSSMESYLGPGTGGTIF